VIHGSGFVIDGLLFTSGHIAANDRRVKVDRPGRPVESPVMATSVSLDVAVADASGLVAVEMVLGQSQVPEGETVFVAGFPSGGELETSQARIVGYADAAQWGVQGRRVMLIEPGIQAGFSGGPVMDRDGDVVGMLSGVDSVTGLAIAIPGDELGALVDLAAQTWTRTAAPGSVAHAPQPCDS
jgi:S1-C subfamily serine protease